MSEDTISRKAAIDAHYEYCNKHPDAGFPVWSLKILEDLPSAQPDSKETSSTHKALDTISRQDAIRIVDGIDTWQAGWRGDAIESMKALPSAQPETHEERTGTHSCDCISRQAAISVIAKWMLEYGGEGEERERNALKQAAEEIKDLPSTQPDLSEYSDKLWKAAYERGKAEALAQLEEAYISGETEAEARFHVQQRWIPFKTRPLTEEEKEENPDWDRILDCKLPEDGQAILISVNLRGHESVQYDEFYTDDGSYLDSGYEIGDEAVAWMPLPEPYAERRTDDKTNKGSSN